MLEVVIMARKSHSGESEAPENEKPARSKKEEKRNRKASSDTDNDDEWFDCIDDDDEIPSFRREA